jgi:hypothetical protein
VKSANAFSRSIPASGIDANKGVARIPITKTLFGIPLNGNTANKTDD